MSLRESRWTWQGRWTSPGRRTWSAGRSRRGAGPAGWTRHRSGRHSEGTPTVSGQDGGARAERRPGRGRRRPEGQRQETSGLAVVRLDSRTLIRVVKVQLQLPCFLLHCNKHFSELYGEIPPVKVLKEINLFLSITYTANWIQFKP